MSKLINFHLYRFHLSPLKSNNQLEIFPSAQGTSTEIKSRKNDYLMEILETKLVESSASNPMELFDNSEGVFLYKFANQKTTSYTKDFKTYKLSHEPYVYVIINNDKTVQKIAISENSDAFTSPDTVKNILLKILRKYLAKYGLNIEIEKMFNIDDFWAFANKYQDKIKRIDFEFIKPNLANISSSLPKAFRDFQEKTNGHKGKITIEAPSEGVLEKINKNNKAISGLVEYSSEGGGNISMKIKGLNKWQNTNEKPVILSIDEISIEGAPEQIIKLYKTIFDK